MVRERKNRPARLVLRLIASIGIGLGLAAIWWEYSDTIIQRFLPVLGG